MIPKITNRGAIAPLKPAVLSPESKLVVVYNSRLDTLVNEMTVSASEIKITDIAKDWSLFMHDLSTKMFDKISL
jgi:hypothetical protein